MSVAVLSLLLVTAVAVAREETCVSIEGLGLPSFVEHAAEFASVDTAMTGVFHNPLNVPLERYWDDRRGTGGVYQGLVMPHEAESVGTYAGDEFFFREVDSAGGRGAGAVVARFAMDKARTMYILHCNDAAVLASAEYAALLAQQRWAQDYKRASGVPWISHYGASGPRPPPKHRIWDTTSPGEVHHVDTPHGYWHGDARADSHDATARRGGGRGVWARARSLFDRISGGGAAPAAADAGAPPVPRARINLTVLSHRPQVLHVSGLLSDEECDLIMSLGGAGLHASTLGGSSDSAFSDDTRTSRQSWVGRSKHAVLDDIIFPRFADVLRIDDALLKHDRRGVSSAEELQVVHYTEGQEYRTHVDFFDTGVPSSRFLTLLVYLNDAGEFSFVYRYILRESCSQFDLLPLTYLAARVPQRRRRERSARGRGAGQDRERRQRQRTAPLRGRHILP
jgi:hypothetical protein